MSDRVHPLSADELRELIRVGRIREQKYRELLKSEKIPEYLAHGAKRPFCQERRLTEDEPFPCYRLADAVDLSQADRPGAGETDTQTKRKAHNTPRAAAAVDG